MFNLFLNKCTKEQELQNLLPNNNKNIVLKNENLINIDNNLENKNHNNDEEYIFKSGVNDNLYIFLKKYFKNICQDIEEVKFDEIEKFLYLVYQSNSIIKKMYFIFLYIPFLVIRMFIFLYLYFFIFFFYNLFYLKKENLIFFLKKLKTLFLIYGDSCFLLFILSWLIRFIPFYIKINIYIFIPYIIVFISCMLRIKRTENEISFIFYVSFIMFTLLTLPLLLKFIFIKFMININNINFSNIILINYPIEILITLYICVFINIMFYMIKDNHIINIIMNSIILFFKKIYKKISYLLLKISVFFKDNISKRFYNYRNFLRIKKDIFKNNSNIPQQPLLKKTINKLNYGFLKTVLFIFFFDC